MAINQIRCQAFRPPAGYTRRLAFAVAVFIAGCNPVYKLQTLVPRGGFRGLWEILVILAPQDTRNPHGTGNYKQ